MTQLGGLGGPASAAVALSGNGQVIVGASSFVYVYPGIVYRAAAWVNGSTGATDLGTLGGPWSGAYAVSANGQVIVGYSETTGNEATHAAAWINGSTSATDLGSLGGNRGGFARAVSADGSVIVGGSPMSGDTATHAAAWINGSTLATDLGTLGGINSYAQAVSADGRVIIGQSNTMGYSGWHAAAWINGSTRATDLGTLGGSHSTANAVSADGRVIVGNADIPGNRPSHAVAWINGSTRATDLGTLGGTYSTAIDVSADGRVIVGNANIIGDGATHAASWVNESTRATDLGTLGGAFSTANAVSADGRVIVGNADMPGDMPSHAAAWIDGSTRATDLGTFGNRFSTATAVSDDGTVVIGRVYSGFRDAGNPFIVKLTLPRIQDYTNLIASFGALANDTAVAVTDQQATLVGLLWTDCTPSSESDSCFAASGNLLGRQTDGSIGQQDAGVGQIIAGHRFSPDITAGVSLAFGHVQRTGTAFGDGTQTAGSLWSAYSQNGTFSTGFIAHANISTAHESVTIHQGAGFDNVIPLTGSASLNSTAAQASLSYGLQTKGGWLLTPSARLTWIESHRGAYTETTGVFPASFDKLTTQSSYATVGFSAQTPVNAKSSFSFGAGADIDLNADQAILTGSSALPGMTNFNVTDGLSRNRVRPYVAAGYSRDLSARSTLDLGLQVSTPVYGNAPLLNLGVRYTVSF